MKTRRKFAKLAAVLVLVAGSAMVAGTASAQSFGGGAFHHSEQGALGAANHLTYGDLHSNQMHMHHGYGHPVMHSWHSYSGGYHNGHPMMKYSGSFNDAGHPTGHLHPGMVLPDGAIVISVGK